MTGSRYCVFASAATWISLVDHTAAGRMDEVAQCQLGVATPPPPKKKRDPPQSPPGTPDSRRSAVCCTRSRAGLLGRPGPAVFVDRPRFVQDLGMLHVLPRSVVTCSTQTPPSPVTACCPRSLPAMPVAARSGPPVAGPSRGSCHASRRPAPADAAGSGATSTRSRSTQRPHTSSRGRWSSSSLDQGSRHPAAIRRSAPR